MEDIQKSTFKRLEDSDTKAIDASLGDEKGSRIRKKVESGKKSDARAPDPAATRVACNL